MQRVQLSASDTEIAGRLALQMSRKPKSRRFKFRVQVVSQGPEGTCDRGTSPVRTVRIKG